MPLSPEDFYSHALAATDEEQRLPLSRMTGWDISPFEAEGLVVARLRPPVLPEPPRHGEDPAECASCRRRDEGIWLNERWRLTQHRRPPAPLVLRPSGGPGPALRFLAGHLDDLLPEYPAALAASDADTVVDALVASYGGRRGASVG